MFCVVPDCDQSLSINCKEGFPDVDVDSKTIIAKTHPRLGT